MSATEQAARSTVSTTDSGPSSTAPRNGSLGWIARHPITAFLVLAFALACLVMAVPILADHGVIASGWMPNLPGLDTERIASVFLVFFALLPSVFLVTWAADGRAGLQDLVRRMFKWRFGIGWWVLVLTALPALTYVLARLFGDSPRPIDGVEFLLAQVSGLAVNLLLINILEETAWSGFLQTRLQRTHGLVVAALLTAVPFALVHMPLHFIGDFSVSSLITALITLLIVCALVRTMLGLVLRGTGGSILAVAVMHTMFNRSNNDEGIVAGLVDGDGRKLAGLLAVIVVTVTVALVARYRHRRHAQRSAQATQPVLTDSGIEARP